MLAANGRTLVSMKQAHPVFFWLALALILATVFGCVSHDSQPRAQGGTSCSDCHDEESTLWANSTHQSVACEQCHKTSQAVGAADAPHPGKAIATETCLSCHRAVLRVNELAYSDLPDSSLEVMGLVFAHRKHVEGHGIACTACHPGVVHVDPEILGKYDVNFPTHSHCVACHNGQRLERFDVTLPDREDESRCTLCHPTYDG